MSYYWHLQFFMKEVRGKFTDVGPAGLVQVLLSFFETNSCFLEVTSPEWWAYNMACNVACDTHHHYPFLTWRAFQGLVLVPWLGSTGSPCLKPFGYVTIEVLSILLRALTTLSFWRCAWKELKNPKSTITDDKNTIILLNHNVLHEDKGIYVLYPSLVCSSVLSLDLSETWPDFLIYSPGIFHISISINILLVAD